MGTAEGIAGTEAAVTRLAPEPTAGQGVRRASLVGTGFVFLWLNAVSYQLIGAADRFTFVWLVDDELGAPAWASGLVVFALGAPVVVFVLLAGALADRGDRRRQLLASQLAGMVVTSTLAALVASGSMNVPLAALMAFSFGTAFAFAQPVRMSLVPILVGRQDLQRAVVLMTIGANLASMLGPVVVGGVITRWGIAWAFLVQSALFFAGFLIAWQLRVPKTRKPPTPSGGLARQILAEVREGLAFVWADQRLRWLFFLLGVGGAVMTGATYLLLPKLAADAFDKSADQAAALFAALGVGMVSTSVVLLRTRRLRRRGLVFMVATFFAAIIEMAHALAPSYPVLLATMACWGVTGGFFINMNLVLIQEITPTERIGRVVSLQQMCTFGLSPIGALLAGFVASWIGTRQTIFAFGAVAAALVLVAFARATALRAQA